MFYAEPTPLVTPPRADLRPLRSAHWEPGTRFVHEHGIGFRAPLRVVEDDERGLLGWLAPGSETRSGRRSDGSNLRVDGREDHLSPRIVSRTRWQGPGILRLFLPDRPYAVWYFWDVEGRFAGWYVNLETQALRGDACVASVDQILDVWRAPGRAPVLKDAEEFDDAVAIGRVAPEVAAVVRANADQAMRDVASERWPFDASYTGWRPPAEWGPLPIPERYGYDIDELAD